MWIHRVDEDDSGLTFEEWDPLVDTDDSQSPVIINSNHLGLKEIYDMGPRRYVLSVDNDDEFRSRCE